MEKNDPKAGSLVKWRANIWLMVAGWLGLVVLADWFFYRHPVGFTLGVYAGVLLGFMLWRNHRLLRQTPSRILAAATAGLVLALLEAPGTLAILLCLIGLVSLGFLARLAWCPDILVWLRRWGRFLLKGWLQFFFDLKTVQCWRNSRPGTRRISLAWLRRWFLPVLFSLGFIFLFQ